MLQTKTVRNFTSIAETFSELECSLAIWVFKDFNSTTTLKIVCIQGFSQRFCQSLSSVRTDE